MASTDKAPGSSRGGDYSAGGTRSAFSSEAETACLGAIFLKNELAESVFGRLTAEDFFDSRHRVIAEAIQECRGVGGNNPVDLITISTHLKNSNRIGKAGGLEYLNTLIDTVPTTANWEHYVAIVAEKAMQRRLADCGDQIKSWASDPGIEVSEALNQSLDAVFELGKEKGGRDYAPITDILHETIAYVEQAHRQRGAMGIPTGFRGIDEVIGGLQASNLIIIGARPGMGKTSLAMSLVENISISREPPVPVGIFSLEMSKRELCLRLLASVARVSSEKILRGRLVDRDWPVLLAGAEKIMGAPIYIDDNSGLTLPELTSKCLRMKRQHNIQLLILDYLQLMSPGAGQGSIPREQFVASVSRGLKTLAKALDVPIIALTQLNRNIESRGDGAKKPQLSDIRESGSIEQDADLVLFIYEGETREGEAPPDPNATGVKRTVNISKNRHGRADVPVELMFQKNFTRFENLAHASPE